MSPLEADTTKRSSLSPLVSAICVKKLLKFTRAALSILLADGTIAPSTSIRDVHTIAAILDTRVLPELENIKNVGGSSEIRSNVVKVVLALLGNEELAQWASSIVAHWYRDSNSKGWKGSFEATTIEIVSNLRHSSIHSPSNGMTDSVKSMADHDQDGECFVA